MDAVAARDWIDRRYNSNTLRKLDIFVPSLTEENGKQNLVSRETTVDELWVRHILDSIQLLGLVEHVTGEWLDIGTGAGFPGLICAIAAPEWRFHLVEPRAQRADWLNRVATALDLSNVVVHQKRAQSVEPLEASVVSARAVAKLPTLVTIAKRHSRPEAVWLFPKGRNAAAELRSSRHDHILAFHVERSLTEPNAGIIVRRPVAGGPNA